MAKAKKPIPAAPAKQQAELRLSPEVIKRFRLELSPESIKRFRPKPPTEMDYTRIDRAIAHEAGLTAPSADEQARLTETVVAVSREVKALAEAVREAAAAREAAEIAGIAKAAEITKVSAAEWVAATAKKMKRDGEIPTRITDFAKELGRRMEAAALENPKAVELVGWKHIRNMLPRWGLWPSESIKT